MAEKDADLAVLDPAGRAALLAGDPCRMAALLHKAGLVQNHDADRISQMFDEEVPANIPSFLLIPHGSPEKRLHPPWRRIASILRQLPAILAFRAPDQSIEKQANLPARLGPSKQSSDPLIQRRQLVKSRQRRVRPIRNRHNAAPRDSISQRHSAWRNIYI